MTTTRLPMRTKLAFGVGSAAEAAASIAFNSFNFLFYNQVLGLSGTLCGLAVTIALVLDAVADPIVGSVSDRLRSKWGRRHPFMFLAALPMGLFFALIYSPPAGLSGLGLFAWFTFFTLLFRQAQTLYHVPHLALGAELTSDYHERSTVMAYNALFGVFGGAGAFFFGWSWFGRIEGGPAVRTGYPGMGFAIGIFVAIVIFISAWFTRDRIATLRPPPANMPRFSLLELWREIFACMQNQNYRNLLIGLIFISVALGTRETIASHMSLYFWELPAAKIKVFGLASPPGFILAFFLTAWLHNRFDKRNTLVGAICLLIFAANTPIALRLLHLMPENGSPKLIPVLFLFVFLFYGAIAMFVITALSALGDIADEHELQTGRRQEGVFFAARTFFSQLTTGVGHLVAGLAIDIIKFPVGAKPGEVPANILWELGIVDGPMIAIPSIAALMFYARYNINKERHAEIRTALHERHAQEATARSGPEPIVSTRIAAPGVPPELA